MHTEFVGYVRDACVANVEEIRADGEQVYAVVNRSPFYAEMGGQVGDTGVLTVSGHADVPIANTVQRGPSYFLRLANKADRRRAARRAAHFAGDRPAPPPRHRDAPHRHAPAALGVASGRGPGGGAKRVVRRAGPAALRFQQRAADARADRGGRGPRQPRTLANEPVSWREVPFADMRGREDIMQFFGDKYGDNVRVVQIGGHIGALDGYSMELCAGTHVRATGQLGAFKIVSEGAIAAGIRRIEAVAGLAALNYFQEQTAAQNKRVEELEAKLAEMHKAQEKDKAGAIKRDAEAFVADAWPKIDGGGACRA